MQDAIAYSEESFIPGHVSVEAPDLPNQELRLMLFHTPLNTPPPGEPQTYARCVAAKLDPRMAVALGEHLVAEGRKATSGLVVATELPA